MLLKVGGMIKTCYAVSWPCSLVMLRYLKLDCRDFFVRFLSKCDRIWEKHWNALLIISTFESM